jgi:phosphatidate cytidylyltransferase
MLARGAVKRDPPAYAVPSSHRAALIAEWPVDVKRVATGAILIPIVVALVWFATSALLAVLLGGVVLLTMIEFFRLCDSLGLRGYRPWTMFCAAGVIYVQWAAGRAEMHSLGAGYTLLRSAAPWAASLDVVLLAFVFGCAVLSLCARGPLADVVPAVSASSAALLFIALPLSYIVRLHQAGLDGAKWVLFLLALVWAGDIAAYFAGRAIGRVKMAPLLSPKKTWEGAAANVLASMVVGYFFAGWIGVDLLPMLLLAALANAAGQAGDLLESAYKRGARVKDSGGLLPGHGGMLDRVDSLILATPVVWCYVEWLWPRH